MLSMQLHRNSGSKSSVNVKTSCCSYCGSALVGHSQHVAVCSASPKAVLGFGVRAEGKEGAWIGQQVKDFVVGWESRSVVPGLEGKGYGVEGLIRKGKIYHLGKEEPGAEV